MLSVRGTCHDDLNMARLDLDGHGGLLILETHKRLGETRCGMNTTISSKHAADSKVARRREGRKFFEEEDDG